MKKLLSLLIVMCFILGLVGCGQTGRIVEELPVTSSEEDSDVPVYPEPEDLLLGNYGVDSLDSMTLELTLDISLGDYKETYEGVYEQTEDTIHFDIWRPGEEDSTLFNSYFSITDDIMYAYDTVDSVWKGTYVETFDVGFNRLSNMSASDLVLRPKMVVPKDGDQIFDAKFEENDVLYVEGITDSSVVESMLCLFDAPAFEYPSVTAQFVYGMEDHKLRLMHWDVSDGDDYVTIDAKVADLNSTSIELPFDKDTVEVSGGGVEDIWNSVDGVREGEVSLAKEFFGVDYVRETDFLASIDAEYRDLGGDILYLARYFYNSYSREGFERMLKDTVPTIEDEPMAAVLVCELTGIPFEKLYAGKFMTESDVTGCRTELYNHIYSSD